MHNLLSTVKWLLIIVVILVWLALCLVNREVASPLVIFPNILEFQRVPMSVTLIFPLLVAFVTFMVVGFLDQVDQFMQNRELKKRIRDLEDEVNKLRNLPIREGLLSQRTIEEENKP
jgi:predicted membrane protein